MLVPQGGRGGKEGVGSGWRRNTAAVMVYRSPALLLRRFTRRVLWSFTEKLKASNSNEQLLLRVNCGMERRLQTMDGTTRILFKTNLDAMVGRKDRPRDVIAIRVPLPATIEECGEGV